MKFLISSILIVIAFSGCSKIFLPYHEEPLCNKGYGSGYCGSVSEVYDLTINNDKKSVE